MTNPEHFAYEVTERIATITFDRADKMNAFTRRMGEDFISLIDRAEADEEVRCIVVTGNGRVFCAGADLSASKSSFTGGTGQDEIEFRDFGGVIALRLFDCLKPVIAAYNGPAAGMGVTMMLAADIRLASTTAKFVLPFVRRGIANESCCSWFLPKIVGVSKALEWILTGQSVSAREALESGLVRSLHEPADVLPAARAIATTIAQNTAPVSVALSRQMLWKMSGCETPHEAHRIESMGIHSRSQSDDVKEGVASFMERRDPDFPETVPANLPDFFPWWDAEADR
ncbi:enoyl-CoA hydratase [Novosphingobium marinum]|uniref:Enoyl-CoA hydratase/carnithine racemase n=1 Tax=Novosphingobium marinum TaxID=1514948 RepID=A0A7Y9XVG1_9SPHN|nr:enoyl-CoA hydratase-related protein [Novosphingobium marinum]NYH93998.1 enoyl-CoA hydratase/carnithine racemase [Novosphingobium marinum]GGC18815.1 enoyl-CoA hydratase [Novosphingobium marinum]